MVSCSWRNCRVFFNTERSRAIDIERWDPVDRVKVQVCRLPNRPLVVGLREKLCLLHQYGDVVFC